MTPHEYKKLASVTYDCPPGTDREEYLRDLLDEEIGEVASLFAKAKRDGIMLPGSNPSCKKCGGLSVAGCCGERVYGDAAVNRAKLEKELGDVMWAAVMLSDSIINDRWTVFGKDKAQSASFARREVLFDRPLAFVNAQQLCVFHGFRPESVAVKNIEKLRSRAERGTLHGSGDER